MERVRRNRFPFIERFKEYLYDDGVFYTALLFLIISGKTTLRYISYRSVVISSMTLLGIYWVLESLYGSVVMNSLKKKNLLWMVVIACSPWLVIRYIRWLATENPAARILLWVFGAYSLVILFQVAAHWFLKKGRKLKIFKRGLTKILSCLSLVALLGQGGYLWEFQRPPQTLASVKSAEEGKLWESNQDYLKNWKEEIYETLTDDEKRELFQKLVELECLYLGIEPMNVEVEQYLSNSLLGYYNHEDRIISISKEMLEASREEAMETLLHESHHAYAHRAADSVSWKDKDLMELRMYKDAFRWKKGFENYTSSMYNYEDYYNNPVEVDARAYSEKWTPVYLEYVDSL